MQAQVQSFREILDSLYRIAQTHDFNALAQGKFELLSEAIQLLIDKLNQKDLHRAIAVVKLNCPKQAEDSQDYAELKGVFNQLLEEYLYAIRNNDEEMLAKLLQ